MKMDVGFVLPGRESLVFVLLFVRSACGAD